MTSNNTEALVTRDDFANYATQSDRLMLFERLLAERDAAILLGTQYLSQIHGNRYGDYVMVTPVQTSLFEKELLRLLSSSRGKK